MAVTFPNAMGSNSGGAAPSLSFSKTAGGTPLLAGASGYNGTAEQTISTVVFNTSESLSRIDVSATKGFGGTDFWVFELWKRDAPTATTANVVITPTANIDLSGIAFDVAGAASGTYYRGSPAMMEFEGDDMPAYDVAAALSGDPIMFAFFCSTEPESAPTGSGTATLIAEQNRSVFTTGYQRAYSLVASGAAPDLTVPFNAYGFGGAIGLALIEDAGGGVSPRNLLLMGVG